MQKIDKLVSELEELGLKKRHGLILKTLLTSPNPLDAEELVARTNIPKGRIYAFLRELLGWKLISKTPGKPTKFYVDNFKERILDFIERKLTFLMEKEKTLINLFDEKKPSKEIELLEGRDKFTMEIIKMLMSAENMKIVEKDSLPYFIYPTDEKEYFFIRRIVARRRATLTEKSKAMALMVQKAFYHAYENDALEHVVSESDLEKHFKWFSNTLGRRRFKKMIKEALERMKKFKIKAHVTTHEIPIYFIIEVEKQVLMGIKHKEMSVAITIQNPNVVAYYQEYFEELLKDAYSIEKYLKKFI